MCHWCTQRNWMKKISENIRLADWDVSNTRSSSIPLNITIKTNKNTIFFNTLPEVLPVENLKNIHPLMKSLILVKMSVEPSLAGKLKHFRKNWKNIISRLKYTVSDRELQDTITRSASIAENTRENFFFKKSDFTESADLGNFEKGYSQKSTTDYRSVLSQFFFLILKNDRGIIQSKI